MSPDGRLEPADLLRRALDSVDTVVGQAPSPRAWSRPSPCPGWNARAVLGHLIDGCAQISGLLHDHPVPPLADVAALERLTGNDPAAAWAHAHHRVLEALARSTAPTVQTGRGALDRDEALLTAAVEPLVHGWDLARALGPDHHLDPEVVDALLPDVLALGPELAATGMYAHALDIPPSAPPHEQLLAALGRTP